MVFNRFFLHILVRVVFILAAVTGFATIFLRADLLFTQIILATTIVLQAMELTHFVNRTNRELSRFLAAIKDGDFSIGFGQGEQGKSFQTLNASFSELIDTLKELETEKEAQLLFLNQLVDQIDFGIITFNERDEIEVINRQAMTLLQIPKVANWQNLKSSNARFVGKLLHLQNVKNHLIERRIGNQTHYFSVSSTGISIREHHYRIVSLQDIRSEIQQKEIEAWHKLIRILTHEIMNSVTPLVSLTETVQMLLTSENDAVKRPAEISAENIEDVHHALDTIKSRSEGILGFVEDYRKLTRIPQPEFKTTSLLKVLNAVCTLMKAEITSRNVLLTLPPRDHTVQIDDNLIQQVLINLTKNALEANVDLAAPQISFFINVKQEFTVLQITDNGPGIPAEKLEKIFIPFYTTKPEGSGVGLSICRQIMSLHGGVLDVESTKGKTTFSLNFPTRPIS